MYRSPIVNIALILCMILHASASMGPLSSFLPPAPIESELPDQDDDPMPDPENVVVEATDVTGLHRIDTTVNVCTDVVDISSTRLAFHVIDCTFTPSAVDTIYALKQLRI